MNARPRRVAITGLGLVTPAGNDVASTWATLLAGASQGAPITIFDASGFSTRIAAEVKGFDARAVIDDRRALKFATRSHAFALAAADQAFADAGIRPTRRRPQSLGPVGRHRHDGHGLARTLVRSASRPRAATTSIRTGCWPRDTGRDPLVFCRSQTAAGLALLGRRYGIGGYATSVHTACASGGQALGTAMKMIRRGTVDCALAGGFDSMINPVGLAGFCLLGAVSPDNDTPSRASRPFDASRNGFVLGEGAGFVVLEAWEHAVARGATIYAELAGDGNSLSSYRITDSHPSGDGPIQAMRWALADAGATPADVDYVNAHGTSTPMNDRSESAAMHAVFGERIGGLAVSSTKSTMGHLIAAAGAVEAAVCALAIRHGTLPVNANYQDPDPDCALDLVVGAPRTRPVRVAMSNSLRLRRLELEPRVPPSRPRRGRRDVKSGVVVTGTGALCGAGRSARGDPRRDPRRHERARGRSSRGTSSTGRGRSPPRSPDYNAADARGRPQAAEADPPHRRVRPLRGERGGRALGLRRASRRARAGRRGRVQRAHRPVRGLGRRQLPEPVRLLPADRGLAARRCRRSAASSPARSTRCGC